MQVSIHPDFADLLLELLRESVEAAGRELTPEQEQHYAAFRESVAKGKARRVIRQKAKQQRRDGLAQVSEFLKQRGLK